jgi:hypothetical protein
MVSASAISNPAGFCTGICVFFSTGTRDGPCVLFLPILLLNAFSDVVQTEKDVYITDAWNAHIIYISDARFSLIA